MAPNSSTGLYGNPRYVEGHAQDCPVARSHRLLAAEIRSAKPSASFRFTPAEDVRDGYAKKAAKAFGLAAR